jgi:hypothetical protein
MRRFRSSPDRSTHVERAGPGDLAMIADRDGVPDLPDLAAALRAELDDLVIEAAAHPG